MNLDELLSRVESLSGWRKPGVHSYQINTLVDQAKLLAAIVREMREALERLKGGRYELDWNKLQPNSPSGISMEALATAERLARGETK